MSNPEGNGFAEGLGTELEGAHHLHNNGAFGVRIIVEELVAAHHHFQTAEVVFWVFPVAVEEAIFTCCRNI